MGFRDRLVIGRRGPGYTDQMIVDWWSLIHFTSGLLLYLVGLEFIVALSILILFEFWENGRYGTAFFRNLPDWTGSIPIVSSALDIDGQSQYQGDSWGNLFFDILFGIAGFWAGGLL
jgi:hypothetical protein